MALPTKRHIGRSALLDDDPEAFQLGYLVPNGKGPTSDPLAVRAVTTDHGWRGYVVDAPVSQGQCEWSRDHWNWETSLPASAPTHGHASNGHASNGHSNGHANGQAAHA